MMAILSAILFGVATPASKLLLDSLTPFQLAGLLYLGTAIAVAPAALQHGGLALPQRADRRNRLGCSIRTRIITNRSSTDMRTGRTCIIVIGTTRRTNNVDWIS